jgi:hypothetical protein
VSGREAIIERPRELDGRWVTLCPAWGKGAILPARGKLDIAPLDQG